MPAFQFQSVLLHQLPDLQGWQIIGIKDDGTRVLIASMHHITGQDQAERLANQLAKDLAGKPYAEVD